MLSKKLIVTIKGNEYEIKFPNNGQLIDIETNKKILSKGVSSRDLLFDTESAQMAFLAIEMISTFRVLLPELEKHLMGHNKSLMDLDLQESKELTDIYQNQYLGWFNDWMKEINGAVKEEVPIADEDEEVIEAK